MTKPVLLIIDPQNDYFPDGAFPLANTETTLHHILEAIKAAKKRYIPIVLIQQIADPAQGFAPFCNPDTQGVEICPQVLAAAADAPVIVKHDADSFEKTQLQSVLQGYGADELIIAGMMTQNCVAFTALSKPAQQQYQKVTVLTDATTTVSELLHQIALHALSTRVHLTTTAEALA